MPYSYKNQYPINQLPHRIRLSNGSTRTDSLTFTTDELTDAGYVAVSTAPTYNSRTEKLSWEGTDWQVVGLTTSRINSRIAAQWNTVREERDKVLSDFEWKIMRYHSEVRLGITTTTDTITDLDSYMQNLRNIPATQSDPYNITWPKEPNEKSLNDE